MKKNKFPIVFDCTLREAGFQTNWHFDDFFVKMLYEFYDKNAVDYIELGFCNSKEHYSKLGTGIFRYCGSAVEEINNLFGKIKRKAKISAMIDIQRPMDPLPYKKDIAIDAIRILTRSKETNLDILKKHVMDIREKGYECFVNFTSAGNNSKELNESFVKFAVDNNIPCIYFADTESIFTPEYVEYLIKLCHAKGIKCGIHLHNQNATGTKLLDMALKNDVDYTDFTLLGFGGKGREGNISNEHFFYLANVEYSKDYTEVRNTFIDQIIKYHIN